MKPLLSILIPTVKERWREFENLRSNIYAELNEDGFIREVEILSICDNKEMTIGEKRELLYKEANGLYSIQLDDDDQLSRNAIELILEAIKSNPEVDCVTFEEYIEIDGVVQRSNHSLKYDDWADRQDGYDYIRTPFMKDVIKTEIARSVPIPHIRFGEDHEWSKRLKPFLKTEIHINQQLYRYIYKSKPNEDRYGLNK